MLQSSCVLDLIAILAVSRRLQYAKKGRRGLLSLKKLPQISEYRQMLINQMCLQQTEILLEYKLTSKFSPLVQHQQLRALSSPLLNFTAVAQVADPVCFLSLVNTEGHYLCTLSLHVLELSCIFCPHQLLPQCCLVSACNEHLVKPLELKSLPAGRLARDKHVGCW